MFGWFKKLVSKEEPSPAAALPRLEAAKAHWARRGRPADQVNALEELAACGGDEARALIESALKDVSSLHAQIAAARLLADLGDKASIPALKRVAGYDFWKATEEARAQGESGMGVGRQGGLAAARADAKLVQTACENALKRLLAA